MYNQIEKTVEKHNHSWIFRRHFIVGNKMGEKSALLTDLSMNGTWVNGVKVGKDRQMILSHCSDSIIYIYKYIVGSILGMGSISAVRRS